MNNYRIMKEELKRKFLWKNIYGKSMSEMRRQVCKLILALYLGYIKTKCFRLNKAFIFP